MDFCCLALWLTMSQLFCRDFYSGGSLVFWSWPYYYLLYWVWYCPMTSAMCYLGLSGLSPGCWWAFAECLKKNQLPFPTPTPTLLSSYFQFKAEPFLFLPQGTWRGKWEPGLVQVRGPCRVQLRLPSSRQFLCRNHLWLKGIPGFYPSSRALDLGKTMGPCFPSFPYHMFSWLLYMEIELLEVCTDNVKSSWGLAFHNSFRLGTCFLPPSLSFLEINERLWWGKGNYSSSH